MNNSNSKQSQCQPRKAHYPKYNKNERASTTTTTTKTTYTKRKNYKIREHKFVYSETIRSKLTADEVFFLCDAVDKKFWDLLDRDPKFFYLLLNTLALNCVQYEDLKSLKALQPYENLVPEDKRNLRLNYEVLGVLATQKGQFEIFRWIASQKELNYDEIAKVSASSGNLGFIRWLETIVLVNYEQIVLESLINDQVKVLKYALSQSKHSKDTWIRLFSSKTLTITRECLEVLSPEYLDYAGLMMVASVTGKLSVLEWLEERSEINYKAVAEVSAMKDNLKIIEWAHSAGYVDYEKIEQIARAHEHLNIVTWAKKQTVVDVIWWTDKDAIWR